MNLKKYIPKSFKLSFKLLKRSFDDRNIPFSKNNKTVFFKNKIEIIQDIKKGHFFENKVHNFKIVTNSIQKIEIKANEVFSFWKIVGKPTAKNGFKNGRNIVNGKVHEQVGGGICQVSGLIYYLALKANLEILERHNHTVDIYAEEDRFTPLGADATVVYGYKDVRFRNNSSGIIYFEFEIKNDTISGKLVSEIPILKSEILFEIIENETSKLVNTFSNSVCVANSVYKVL